MQQRSPEWPQRASAASMNISEQTRRLIHNALNSPDILNRCDLERIDGHEMSVEVFSRTVRSQGRAVVLTGVADFGQAENNHVPIEKDAFLASFGQLQAQASNGRFDGKRKEEHFHVADLLSLPESDLKFFLTDVCYDLHREVLQKVEPAIPSFLEDFVARPVLSVGTRAAATWFHQHDETWFMLLAGKKAWWVADNSTYMKVVESIDPCQLLGAAHLPAGIKFFVQQPGDLLYLPSGVPHATVNLDTFTFGLGSQGHTETWPMLLRAAQRGDVDAVRELAARGEQVDAVNPDGENALHRAALRGDLEMANVLLGEDRGKLLIANRKGNEPIHIAATHGHVPLAAVLLEKRSSVHERRKDGESPLNLASSRGHASMAAFLIEQRADPNSVGHNSVSPLHHAADVGAVSLIDVLLGGRADLNALESAQGQQPIHWAAERGHLAAARALVQAGGSCSAKSSDGAEPLHTAVRGGHESIVAWLVDEVGDRKSVV